MPEESLPWELPNLTEEQREALLVIGSGDIMTGIRRSWLLAQARYETSAEAQRFAELLEEDEGIDPDVAALVAMQAFGFLAPMDRAWMGVPATTIAGLVDPAWRRAKARSLAWVQEHLRCALGMNRVEVASVAQEVFDLLREREALRAPRKRAAPQRSVASKSTRR